MGTMRVPKPRQQAKVKEIHAEKGFRAAVAEAKGMAS